MHCVQALTVPLHLALIDGPFVLHNLISNQDSPVPLLKFQMAPRLKLLMSSGSKKGTQIYLFFSFKTSRQENTLQVPQRCPYGQRYPLTNRYYISLDISLNLKGPKKRASIHVPLKRCPYENRRQFQGLT